VRYLALGDSYTIGEQVEAAERWPGRLTALLRAGGIAIDGPEIVARTGWTSGDLLAAVEQAAARGPYDLVTLRAGVNDQYRGTPAGDYRPAFRLLVARGVALAGGEAGRLVVLSIPDWGATPFAAGRDRARIAREIDRFNDVNREETLRAGGRYVDVTADTRREAAPGGAPRVTPDGLHPSAAVHDGWARLVLPQARAALGAARQE